MEGVIKIREKRVIICGFVLSILLILSIVLVYQFYRENKELRNSVPYLLEGEKITYFDLIGADSKAIDAAALNNEQLSLILIFKQPCSRCNESLKLWERLAKIVSGKAEVYGIILDMNEMVRFAERGNLNFKLYAPANLDKFKKMFRLKLNFAQTILYHNKRVVFLKMGTLTGDDFLDILDKVKKLTKGVEENGE